MGVVLVGLVSVALAGLGVRLLRLPRTSGETPERWLGGAFASAGASAWLLPLAASGLLDPELSRRLALAAQAGMTAAIACFVLFAWRVFRPGSRGARALACALLAVNALAAAAVVAGGTPVPVGPVGLVVVLARASALLWLFAESTLHAVRMRRRLHLGLADPIVANRFLLWSIWTGALALIPLFVLAMRALGGLEPAVPGAPLPGAVRAVLAVLGSGGAAAAVAVWLAFFPPAAYRRWLVARAATVAP